jgi:hypothetical protein
LCLDGRNCRQDDSPFDGVSARRQVHDAGLEAKVLSIKKFAVACAYGWNGDGGLRKLVIKAIANHVCLFKKPLIEDFLSEHGDIAVGVLKNKGQEYGWQ